MNPTRGSSQKLLITDQGAFVQHIAWTPTTDDSWKLNFAGCASALSNTAGAGCILRDQNAVFKVACAAPLKDCESITMAELMALQLGLDLAITQGVDYLEVEGDSPIVFQLLQGRMPPLSSLTRTLVEQCIHYLEKFRCVKVRQLNFKANEVANAIATLSIGWEKPYHWFDNPPPEIAHMLVSDVVGRWVPASDL